MRTDSDQPSEDDAHVLPLLLWTVLAPTSAGCSRSTVNHLDGLSAGCGKRAEPDRPGHYWLPTTRVEANEQNQPTNQELARYWTDVNLEVLVLLEGNDVTSSFPVQARHSYYFPAGEIVFDQMFDHCLRANPKGGCDIDFNSFHKTHPVAADAFELDGASSHP